MLLADHSLSDKPFPPINVGQRLCPLTVLVFLRAEPQDHVPVFLRAEPQDYSSSHRMVVAYREAVDHDEVDKSEVFTDERVNH
jgi:hypothetical protein